MPRVGRQPRSKDLDLAGHIRDVLEGVGRTAKFLTDVRMANYPLLLDLAAVRERAFQDGSTPAVAAVEVIKQAVAAVVPEYPHRLIAHAAMSVDTTFLDQAITFRGKDVTARKGDLVASPICIKVSTYEALRPQIFDQLTAWFLRHESEYRPVRATTSQEAPIDHSPSLNSLRFYGGYSPQEADAVAAWMNSLDSRDDDDVSPGIGTDLESLAERSITLYGLLLILWGLYGDDGLDEFPFPETREYRSWFIETAQTYILNAIRDVLDQCFREYIATSGGTEVDIQSVRSILFKIVLEDLDLTEEDVVRLRELPTLSKPEDFGIFELAVSSTNAFRIVAQKLKLVIRTLCMKEPIPRNTEPMPWASDAVEPEIWEPSRVSFLATLYELSAVPSYLYGSLSTDTVRRALDPCIALSSRLIRQYDDQLSEARDPARIPQRGCPSIWVQDHLSHLLEVRKLDPGRSDFMRLRVSESHTPLFVWTLSNPTEAFAAAMRSGTYHFRRTVLLRELPKADGHEAEEHSS
jgi:hypothetical protein